MQSSDYVGSAILRYRGKLAATVTPAGKATLKLRGRGVGSLKAGKYDVVVDDEDARDGFFAAAREPQGGRGHERRLHGQADEAAGAERGEVVVLLAARSAGPVHRRALIAAGR